MQLLLYGMTFQFWSNQLFQFAVLCFVNSQWNYPNALRLLVYLIVHHHGSIWYLLFFFNYIFLFFENNQFIIYQLIFPSRLCLEGRTDYEISWKNGVINNRLGLIIEHIRIKSHNDRKYSLTLGERNKAGRLGLCSDRVFPNFDQSPYCSFHCFPSQWKEFK